jgi:hypothetical protein
MGQPKMGQPKWASPFSNLVAVTFAGGATAREKHAV